MTKHYDIIEHPHHVVNKKYVEDTLSTAIDNLDLDQEIYINKGGNFYGIRRSTITGPISDYTVVQVPKYKVNSNNLEIYKNGVLLTKDIDYIEIGNASSSSVSVTFTFTIETTDNIQAIVYILHPIVGDPSDPNNITELLPPDWTSIIGSEESPIELNYYVNVTNGVDTNDGKTVATAFKTIQQCCSDFNTYIGYVNAIVHLAAGEYNVITSKMMITCTDNTTATSSVFLLHSQKKLAFIGDGIDQTFLGFPKKDVTSANVANYSIQISNCVNNITFSNMTLYNAILRVSNSNIRFSNMKFITYFNNPIFTFETSASTVTFDNVELSMDNTASGLSWSSLCQFTCNYTELHFYNLFIISNFPDTTSTATVGQIFYSNAYYVVYIEFHENSTFHMPSTLIKYNRIFNIGHPKNSLRPSVKATNCEWYIRYTDECLLFQRPVSTVDAKSDVSSMLLENVNLTIINEGINGYFINVSENVFELTFEFIECTFSWLNASLNSFFYIYGTNKTVDPNYYAIHLHINNCISNELVTIQYKYYLVYDSSSYSLFLYTYGGGIASIPGVSTRVNTNNVVNIMN
jgi:hypothetical protein